MPNVKMNQKVAKEKTRLAGEIDTLYPRLTGQQLMEVAVAAKCSLATVQRYRTEVKKIAVAESIVAEMNARIPQAKAA